MKFEIGNWRELLKAASREYKGSYMCKKQVFKKISKDNRIPAIDCDKKNLRNNENEMKRKYFL